MMTPTDKYQADDPAFDYEHGLLKNKLGLIDGQALERAENEALLQAYDLAATDYSETHVFTSGDVRKLHRLFLGGIFDWAGEYRGIDISSPDIRWCHARFIDKEMARLDEMLRRYTPFSPIWSREEVLQKLAEIHGELIVIHPFRDGNGRTARTLANLLLMQAERHPFHMTRFNDSEIRKNYFTAIQEVWRKGIYGKLIRLFDLLVPQD